MTETKQIECEIYDRCVGYYRPVKHMNIGKREEQASRKRATVTAETVQIHD